jgi:hypothetical protein
VRLDPTLRRAILSAEIGECIGATSVSTNKQTNRRRS